MIYFVFAYNEHMALGGSEDCQGIFDNFSGALLKAVGVLNTFEDVTIETIRDNEFKLIAYKSGKVFINEDSVITIQGWDAIVKIGKREWNIELNQPNKELGDLIVDKLLEGVR